ncbi:hypothetical protein GKZ89_00670 [Bacillus mangrovi]|uniref:Uncharacterized protein n=1 Tax=Metabacillus mangrovi TaxID=1491830 RepID=A0A7X2V3E0_9BACI|nr:hypothetical protein [Metabacillus mangrovi]MTH51901.1 hypothetical protein [Metabacillus mangrovi]
MAFIVQFIVWSHPGNWDGSCPLAAAAETAVPEDRSFRCRRRKKGAGDAESPSLFFCAVTAYAGITYFTPYMQKVYGMSAFMAGVPAILRTYVVQMIGGPLGGFLSVKPVLVVR